MATKSRFKLAEALGLNSSRGGSRGGSRVGGGKGKERVDEEWEGWGGEEGGIASFRSSIGH